MTVTALPLGFDSAAEAHRIRKTHRTGRRLTAPTDVAIAEGRLREALVDVSRHDVDFSVLVPTVRTMLSPLPDVDAAPMAETLVTLGRGYEWSLRTLAEDRDDAWRALWSLAAYAAEQCTDGWLSLRGAW